MVLQKRETKFKILTSSGSLQPLMANKDDDLSCSMVLAFLKATSATLNQSLQLAFPIMAKHLRWKECYKQDRLWALAIQLN
ncbi:hypothetical protein NC653_002361 [Populus alba x Populus x berolinensis]|uniref:Uncharacterized protein n=1 Tax=Populus alba x Populus x berolinensis TaxID=444605 RepID=A0AAD6WHR8_9ROSI|nr:hypothetical protein NC653_002361 [Populus alba x Populus x berolinensis]